MNKKICFLTGTRADYGKIKSLIQICEQSPKFDVSIFVTGMHLHKRYGSTFVEIEKEVTANIFKFINQGSSSYMDITLASTVDGFSKYIRENPVDLIVVHGDRVEALAGAVVGALNNILVAHIEGGEVSGTIDEFLRHATSKMSHSHFVANEKAKKRLIQLGEKPESVFIIGSPDIDILLSNNLPSFQDVKSKYEIEFDDYGVVLYHPVTTEIESIEDCSNRLCESLINSNQNYVVIYPNNDLGSDKIMSVYNKYLMNRPQIRILPSMRFEYFLSMLKNSYALIGNSSAGIFEAPVYGVPTINVGSRQEGRFYSESIINTTYEDLGMALNKYMKQKRRYSPTNEYGDGNASSKFYDVLGSKNLWEISKQKKFIDI